MYIYIHIYIYMYIYICIYLHLDMCIDYWKPPFPRGSPFCHISILEAGRKSILLLLASKIETWQKGDPPWAGGSSCGQHIYMVIGCFLSISSTYFLTHSGLAL